MPERKEVRDLDEGGYVLIDGEPCVIKSYSTSSPGKHGSAKARVEGRGVFDDERRTFTDPVGADVDVPIIHRKEGQVVSKSDGEVQIMDLETYETFKLQLPEDKEVEEDEVIQFLELEGGGKRRIVE